LFRWLVAVALLIAGCRTSRFIRDPEFASVEQAVHQSWCDPASAESALPPVEELWDGPRSLDEYIHIALWRNPEIQAARKRLEAAAHQVPVAASLQDPMLTVTAQPEPVQTAAGQQEVMLSASQKLPWFGKLAARSLVAESQTGVARAHLAAVELTTVARVKRAYYELYYVQQAIRVTQAEQQLLREIRDVAHTRYRTGQASQQDVLRAELEIVHTQNELIRLQQQLQSGQAKLARLLHVSPRTAMTALDELPPAEIPGDLDWLQRQAIAARPELHAQLAALDRDRLAVELARLDYQPDVTLGLSWIEVADRGLSGATNGHDSLLLSAGVNLPIYRKRLDSGVRSAEANAVATARGYDALRDETLEQVTDLFAQVSSQQDLLVLFEQEILPTARQTFQVSIRAYQVGEVDFLQLLDNWRQVLRYEVSHRRLEANLRQTMAELEKAVGGIDGLTGRSGTVCYAYATPSPLRFPCLSECGCFASEEVSSRHLSE
jgi:outer membrane protein TolC